MAEEVAGRGEPRYPRVFVGGCSRSGTTFLQRFLAGHSQVHTFPETGVFLRALGMRGRPLPWARLGLSIGKERKALRRLLELGPPTGGPFPGKETGDHPGAGLPPRRFLLKASAQDIAGFLDELARKNQKDVWVEKTPRHVLHASWIRRLVPDSIFFHMVRDGKDVVASIVDRARRYPDRFRRQADPTYGITLWNRSMGATRAAMAEAGHVIVHYHTLASRPRETLEAVCSCIGIPFEEGMLEDRSPGEFVLEEEAWKKPLSGPIRPSPSKFESLFEKDTRDRINRALDQRFYQEIVARLEAGSHPVWSS